VYIIEDVGPNLQMNNLKLPEGSKWTRHTDLTEEQLIFIYPENSIAGITKAGMVSSSKNI